MTLPVHLKGRLSLPVIGSPLFIISNPDLVIEQCKSGVIGAFPALNARPETLLEEWLVRIDKELAEYKDANPNKNVAPFAVNQIVHKSNDRLEHDMEVCIKHKVPIIITSLMAPDQIVGPVHEYGGLVFHDVINVRHAKKAAAAGVDGLILVCTGAGGHAGTLSPFALVNEVREFFDGIIILAGSISTGRNILAAQAAGADLAYMGTRFIATEEANADPAYKQMLIDHAASDIVYSSLFTGVDGNYLKPSLTRAGLDPDNLESADKSTMNFGSMDAKAWKDIWGAGQGLGSIHDAPGAAKLIQQLKEEYTAARTELQGASDYS